MTHLDHCHVQAFYSTLAQGVDLSVRLDWLRSKAPEAFRHLCETDNACASVAVQRKWVLDADDGDPQRGWGDRGAVAASIRKANALLPDGKPNPATDRLLDYLRAALERYAPENLDLMESPRHDAR
jgi:hypothetical protein